MGGMSWPCTFFDGAIFDVTNAENVRICGRGILDGSLVPHPGRNMIRVAFSKRIDISGITLRGILLNGKAITDAAALGIKTNKFVNGLTIR